MTTLREHFTQFTNHKGEEIEALADSSPEYMGGMWVKLLADVPDSVLDTDDSDGGFGNEATRFMAWSKSYVIFFEHDEDSEEITLGRLPRNYQTLI